jgi:hypothetical protein
MIIVTWRLAVMAFEFIANSKPDKRGVPNSTPERSFGLNIDPICIILQA